MTVQRRLPVSIFEDTRKGTLTEDVLSKQSAQFLDDQNPDTGLTLLATAVIEGFPNEVELLLARGASAEGLSLDGATPLLLAVWKCNKKEARVRIVQLLLQKLQAGSGSGSVDKTCGTADGKTALIFAVERRDAECVRLLRKAGAALKTESGLDAIAMATRIGQKMNDWSLDVALDPEKDKKAHDIMTDTVMSYLEYIISWTNRFQAGTLSKSYKLDPKLDEVIHQNVNYDGEPEDVDKFVENIEDFMNTELGGSLKRFFKDNEFFVKNLATKIVKLTGGDRKAIDQALYQQVIYCDDSTSMKRHDRWENQKRLVERLTKLTTRVLPAGEGVALRFINRDLDEADSKLTAENVRQVLGPMTWQPGGDTPIGTNLRSKMLKPLVYDKIADKTFSRPLLVIAITDGMPEPESKSALAEAILECGQKLKEAQYPETSVKFMIGQIGTADRATKFLDSLRGNQDLERTTYITSEKLDATFITDLKGGEKGLDRWLIENLFSPFQA